MGTARKPYKAYMVCKGVATAETQDGVTVRNTNRNGAWTTDCGAETCCESNLRQSLSAQSSRSQPPWYLRQPAVLVSTDSHSMWRGLQSSPGSRSQPECGMTTSSVKACSAWSTISIFMESWDERFHRVPGRDHSSDSSPAPRQCV